MNRYSSPLSSSSSTMTVTLQPRQPSLHPLILSPAPLKTPAGPSQPLPQPSPRSPSVQPRIPSESLLPSQPPSSCSPPPSPFTSTPSQSLLESSPSKNSLVMPQPRKPIATPQILPSLSATLFSEKDCLEEQHEEALTELLEIIRSSSQSGLMRSQTPRAYYSPKEEEEEEDDDMMDIPTLSNSPLSDSRSYGSIFPQAKGLDFMNPPFRAQNPLAFSCQCTPLSQGAELDLLRPSPPPYLEASSHFRYPAWD